MLLFARDGRARASERQALEASLRRALERSELLLYYQPQIALADRAQLGWEALARWRHPELGLVSPAQFIPLAEECGLIADLDD